MATSSISQCSGLVQGDCVELSDYGIHARFKGLIRGKHLDGVKRGKIRSWSASSVRRLRETLLKRYIPNSSVYGVTLTLPWKSDIPNIGDVFRASLKRFRDYFSRIFPNSACVYRVELQQRQMPHLHLIAFFSSLDKADDLSAWFMLNWWRHGFADLRDGSMDGYIKYGVKVEPMGENVTRLIQYLCDHASKKKQVQLGWSGRQWGIIGSGNLVFRPVSSLPPFPTSRAEGYFWRLVHRFTRYRVKDEKKLSGFEWRYTKPRRKFGVTFGVSPDTARRFYDLAINH